jgi:hypothetical protein
MNQGQIETIVNQRLAILKEEIKEELRAEFQGRNMTRKNNSSGHKKAGESWERSPKGSKWKAELEAAKEELKRIIGERTGQDAYANQQLVTKYASAKRKGNAEEMSRIVEEVVANISGETPVVTAAPNTTRRNRNNNRNMKANINTTTNINTNMNTNMNRLMNAKYTPLPQKPVTPLPAAAPGPVPKPIEEPNEFNLTEPFTYGDDPMGPY